MRLPLGSHWLSNPAKRSTPPPPSSVAGMSSSLGLLERLDASIDNKDEDGEEVQIEEDRRSEDSCSPSRSMFTPLRRTGAGKGKRTRERGRGLTSVCGFPFLSYFPFFFERVYVDGRRGELWVFLPLRGVEGMGVAIGR